MEKRGKEALIDVGFLSPQLFLPSVFSQDRKSDTKMFLLPTRFVLRFFRKVCEALYSFVKVSVGLWKICEAL